MIIEKKGKIMKRYLGLLLCASICFSGNIVKTSECGEAKSFTKELRKANRVENNNVAALNELLNDYYVMLEQNPLDERLSELITKTEGMIDMLENGEVSVSSSRIGGASTHDVLPALTFPTATSLVIDAIAAFSAAGYKLSAELLTVAFGNTNPDRTYVPVYGGRMITSSQARAKAYGTLSNGNLSFGFDLSNTTNENDMSLAIHSADFTKPYSTSKVVSITDTYNFDGFEGQDNGFLNFANGTFSIIQGLGVITPYTVNISVDFSKDLDISVESYSSGTYSINVTNNTSAKQLVVYNKRMCNLEDARNWTNLTDIDYMYLNSGESRSVNVSERGTATSVAFSLVTTTTRYISSAFQLSVDGSLSREQTSVNHNSYYNLDIIGKDGDEWILRYKNLTSSNIPLDYNSRMCYLSDAENWTNLRNQDSIVVYPSSDGFFRIEEYGTAGAIAVRYRIGSYYYYIYANNLSSDTTMSAHRRSEYYYEYLSLVNHGKSGGKWKIEIYNPKSYEITVYYNKKMCFQSDAMNWTNLRDDRDPITIPPNDSVEVSISTNGTAGFITTSYIENNHRVITCANGLSTSGAIAPRNNVVGL